MQRIIYVSNVCSPEYFKSLVEKNNISLSSNIQNHHNLLIEGLDMNNVALEIISVQPLNIDKRGYYKPSSEVIGNRTYHYLAAVNIPLIRHFFDIFFSFVQIWKATKKNENATIFIDTLIAKNGFSALVCGKLRKLACVGFISDNPDDMYPSKFSFEKILTKINIKLCDAYVLVTPHQVDFIRKNKPFIIIESQSNIKLKPQSLNTIKEEPKVILFAGALTRYNGVDILVNAFIKWDRDDIILRLFGVGELEQEIRNLTKEHKNIQFMGYRSNNEIIQEEMRATLLVIPRPTHQGISKYSFPIKLMEYMSSGTAVLTTDFSSIPEDYKPYLLFIKECSVDGLAKSLNDIFILEESRLKEIGSSAQTWIYKNKNNVIQAKKLYDFIELVKKSRDKS